MHGVSRSSLYLYDARYKCGLQKECELAAFVEVCSTSESRHRLLLYVAMSVTKTWQSRINAIYHLYTLTSEDRIKTRTAEKMRDKISWISAIIIQLQFNDAEQHTTIIDDHRDVWSDMNA